ncbi:hypothetical protein [Bradyrhizobium mercantei]|uniref:hypothetical protein n=1 Tax=Bradyrhizobium mercantei TaxID=1904807 RepID=UPI001FD988BA
MTSTEYGGIAEPLRHGYGSSNPTPQKRNPISFEFTVRQLAGLTRDGLVQDFDCVTGFWYPWIAVADRLILVLIGAICSRVFGVERRQRRESHA